MSNKSKDSESDKSKGIEQQHHENIDKIIDKAVENAEARRELSQDELDKVDGGQFPIIMGMNIQ